MLTDSKNIILRFNCHSDIDICFVLQEMVVGTRSAGLEMTESRLHAMAAARSLLDSLPYKLDVAAGLDALKHPYDHNKNAVNDTKDSLVGRLPHPPSSSSHLQPFTASWLSEVARINPAARADHLPFVPPSPLPTHSAAAIPEYYSHFTNLPSRASYYNHPMFAAPHPYLRDYPPRPPIRPYPLVDPRRADSQTPRSPPNPSQILPHVRPLGPPPPPPRIAELPTDLRDPRSDLSNEELSRNLHGEPSPKRRNTQTSSFPFPPPSARLPSHRSKASRVTSPESQGEPASSGFRAVSSGLSRGSPQSRKSPKKEKSPPRDSSGDSFYPHFQKGALVAVGSEIRRVEDMRTEDFICAADAAEDLTLDPPSVSSIVMASSGATATINFNFVSRNTEVGYIDLARSLIFVSDAYMIQGFS